jgi:ATP-dependent protease ClpP protease subunit
MGEVIPKIRRPDPARTVKVSGPLTVPAAERVAAALHQLAQESPAPITLDIRSSGGEAAAFYHLAAVLASLSTKGKKCRIYTVAHDARSAAAYLAVVGHRAFALPNTKLGLHGTRGVLPKNGKPLTRETALATAMHLDRENRLIARILAKHLVFRLAVRQRELRAGTSISRAKDPLAILENLTRQLSEQLKSARARRVLNESFERCKLVCALSPLFSSPGPLANSRTLAAQEVKIFQAAIAYEFAANRGKKWRLDATAGTELLMDYLLAKDFLQGEHWKLAHRLARRFGQNFLTATDSSRYVRLLQQDPVKAEALLIKSALPGALGLWYFTMTLCHRLLMGEHSFSAQDAYWLGLVDEVLPAEPPAALLR